MIQRRISGLLTTTLLLILLSSANTAAQEPALYQAYYQARAAGLSATAERRLEKVDEQQFRLRQDLEVRVLGARLGTIEESSVFTFQEGHLVPLTYTYDQSGINRRERAVLFDWENRMATSSEDDDSWSLPISQGVADRLNFQLLLRLHVQQDSSGDIPLDLVDGDEIESHLYRVTGSEIIETPLGRLDTIRVERIREPGSERRTIFWLARDWELLLVRFLQTEKSATDSELLLKEATIAGRQVTPLP